MHVGAAPGRGGAKVYDRTDKPFSDWKHPFSAMRTGFTKNNPGSPRKRRTLLKVMPVVTTQDRLQVLTDQLLEIAAELEIIRNKLPND